MWTKKNNFDKEIEQGQERKTVKKNRLKKALKVFVFIFCIAFLLFFFINWTGYSKYRNDPSLPFNEAFKKTLQYIPIIGGFSIVGFVLTFISNNSTFTKARSNTYMCEKCNDKIYGLNETGICKCGGKYYSIDSYKWSEEN